MANVMEFAGVSLREAIDMTSKNPAKLLDREVARLRRGSLADLVVFRVAPNKQRLDVEATVASGHLMYGEIVTR